MKTAAFKYPLLISMIFAFASPAFVQAADFAALQGRYQGYVKRWNSWITKEACSLVIEGNPEIAAHDLRTSAFEINEEFVNVEDWLKKYGSETDQMIMLIKSDSNVLGDYSTAIQLVLVGGAVGSYRATSINGSERDPRENYECVNLERQ